MFSGYCNEPFTVEMCKVKSSCGEVNKYPDLKVRQEVVKVNELSKRIGINLPAQDIAGLLTRMCLTVSIEDDYLLVMKL